MAIQRNTEVKEFSIELKDEKALLDHVREKIEGKNMLNFTSDNVKVEVDEIYLQGDSIYVAIRLNDMNEKDLGYIYFEIPMSRDLLVDFLTYNIKQMNKLKSVWENLP